MSMDEETFTKLKNERAKKILDDTMNARGS